MKYTPEQQKAIETVDKNLVVTAGAGAGKTRVLVARILYIIKQGMADIDEIVAITYTNKAALEIRDRLRKEMMKEKNDRVFLKNLRKLGIAYIGTIHSFCLRLLKENPVEAGIDPDVKILEEYRANAWLKDSIEETVLDNLENKFVFQLTFELGFSKLVRELYNTMLKMQNQGNKPSVIDKMAAPYRGQNIDLVVGPEARGFVIGAPLAYALNAGFVPIRKPGKLPADTLRYEYSLEYGKGILEIHRDAIVPGQRVLIVDDLLATGGTVEAAINMVKQLGGEIAGLAFLIELTDLGGRTRLADYNITSVVQY